MKPIILLLSVLPLIAQFSSTAYHIAPGASLPATCNPANGDVYFKTSPTISMYYCSATNTWSAMGLAGGGIAGIVDSVETVEQVESLTFSRNALNRSTKALAVGADATVHFVLIGDSNAGVTYVHCSTVDCATRTETDIATTGGPDDASVAVGSDDLARILYLDDSSGSSAKGVHYVQCLDASCSSRHDNRIAVINFSLGGAFYLSGSNIPTIVYTDDVSRDTVKVVVCADVACAAVASTNTLNGSNDWFSLDIILGTTGFPFVLYSDGSDSRKLYLYACADAPCSSGSSAKVDNTLDLVSKAQMVNGSDSRTRIVFSSNTNGVSKYASCTDVGCSIFQNQAVILGDFGFEEISFYLDSSNLVHLLSGESGQAGLVIVLTCNSICSAWHRDFQFYYGALNNGDSIAAYPTGGFVGLVVQSNDASNPVYYIHPTSGIQSRLVGSGLSGISTTLFGTNSFALPVASLDTVTGESSWVPAQRIKVDDPANNSGYTRIRVEAGKQQSTTNLAEWGDSAHNLISGVSPDGRLFLATVAFTDLGSPSTPQVVNCSDCTVTSAIDNTCASGSGPSVAFRIGSAWKCLQ